MRTDPPRTGLRSISSAGSNEEMAVGWINGAKIWAKGIKRDVLALWFAARDRRTPWYAKLVAAMVAAYALSPIDLIPDFIPILGYLDDLLIVPLGILLAVRLIPPSLMDELRTRALDQQSPRSIAGLLAVGGIWLGTMVLAAWLMWPSLPSGTLGR
jgi:uncharacterized membrane protein YkvA (DUF1232 family)